MKNLARNSMVMLSLGIGACGEGTAEEVVPVVEPSLESVPEVVLDPITGLVFDERYGQRITADDWRQRISRYSFSVDTEDRGRIAVQVHDVSGVTKEAIDSLLLPGVQVMITDYSPIEGVDNVVNANTTDIDVIE